MNDMEVAAISSAFDRVFIALLGFAIGWLARCARLACQIGIKATTEKGEG